MNNSEVQRLLDDCHAELVQVRGIIDGLGMASSIVPYLTKYSLIRACGTIEQSFKTIIADCCSRRSKKQVKRFLDQKVRDSSMNPSYDNICKLLKAFDEDWCKQFKDAVSHHPHKTVLTTSLQSLVDGRNDFAHGGSPSATIGDVQNYYLHSRTIIEVIDTKVV